MHMCEHFILVGICIEAEISMTLKTLGSATRLSSAVPYLVVPHLIILDSSNLILFIINVGSSEFLIFNLKVKLERYENHCLENSVTYPII